MMLKRLEHPNGNTLLISDATQKMDWNWKYNKPHSKTMTYISSW